MPSLSSANWFSRASRGLWCARVLACCELRREERDEGRSGVVGRDGMRVREAERERSRWGAGMGVIDVIVGVCGVGAFCLYQSYLLLLLQARLEW
jgi:hypothetical protein